MTDGTVMFWMVLFWVIWTGCCLQAYELCFLRPAPASAAKQLSGKRGCCLSLTWYSLSPSYVTLAMYVVGTEAEAQSW